MTPGLIVPAAVAAFRVLLARLFSCISSCCTAAEVAEEQVRNATNRCAKLGLLDLDVFVAALDVKVDLVEGDEAGAAFAAFAVLAAGLAVLAVEVFAFATPTGDGAAGRLDACVCRGTSIRPCFSTVFSLLSAAVGTREAWVTSCCSAAADEWVASDAGSTLACVSVFPAVEVPIKVEEAWCEWCVSESSCVSVEDATTADEMAGVGAEVATLELARACECAASEPRRAAAATA